MDRKKFLKNTAAGVIGVATSKVVFNSKPKSTFDIMSKNVGFNHLPMSTDQIIKHKTMKTVIHKADTRGHANHGWLDSHHSFSFASYHNPDRMNFGVIRVLNDDIVAAGQGFGKHPHDNMEIISIPLEGDLEHKDSMGNSTIIRQGDIQVMSAGKGIQHSEYNKNHDTAVKFLQIWLFPNQKNVTPRYDQISIIDFQKNQLNQILSPDQNDRGVWIHQDAWFSIGEFENDTTIDYQIKKDGNGLYLFMLEGNAEIEGQNIHKRDGLGIWEAKDIKIIMKKGAKILVMDVPMVIG